MPQQLFCKPHPQVRDHEILFCLRDSFFNGSIAFRSLSLTTDIDTIHHWVNQPYAIRYWQMNGEKEELIGTYKKLLANSQAHSFIGLFNDKIVCQIDCYHVSADEIKEHVTTTPRSCGFHILMLPPRESFKGLTEAMLKAFIQFFFSFGAAETLYAEPDATNTAANIAAKRAGLIFQKTIQLSTKTANLYSITREQFFKSLQHDN